MSCFIYNNFVLTPSDQLPGTGDDRINLAIGVIIANVLYLILYAQNTPNNYSSEISYVGKGLFNNPIQFFTTIYSKT